MKKTIITLISIALVISFVLIYNINSSSGNNNIVIAALGKSGSTYTAVKLASSLQYKLCDNRLWKNEHFMKRFNKGRSKVLKGHIKATDDNINMLAKYAGDKIAVHIRDPRAATLSALYHIQGDAEKIVAGQMPPNDINHLKFMREYLNYTLEEKKEYLVKKRFINKVKWIKDWCDIKEIEDLKPEGLKILITTYDEMVNDEDTFFRRYYEHFDVKQENIKRIDIAKDNKVRYRNGVPNEWRTAFTSAQIEYMNNLIPQALLDRFNWER